VRIDEKKEGEKMNWAKVVFELEKMSAKEWSYASDLEDVGHLARAKNYIARARMADVLLDALTAGFSDDEAREYVQLHGDAKEALENVKI
jgi:hypothetical protein